LKYTNDEDEPVFIRETRLFSGKIELTEPLTPDKENPWKVAAHTSTSFGKTIMQYKSPAASLVKMNLDKGIRFNAQIDVVMSCELRGQLFEIPQSLCPGQCLKQHAHAASVNSCMWVAHWSATQ
jgi:hypothetical protein